MQIRYKHQRIQTEAARSIANAFTGQPKSDGQSDHTIDQGKNKGLFKLAGFGNKNVVLAREAVCENVRAVQTEQGLKPVDYLQDLQGVGMAFTIEMETGTGKTYTYIKTMYELNERYGWTKFVVVVPSIAKRLLHQYANGQVQSRLGCRLQGRKCQARLFCCRIQRQ